MLDHQYKAKQAKLEKRNWPLTITSAILCLFVLVGVVATFRYIEHDFSMFLSIIPLSGIAIVLFLAALNGRKKILEDIYDSILNLIFFWR